MSAEDFGKIKHGGDWSGFLAERGCLPLDFSANVSPLGLPPAARRALSDMLELTQNTGKACKRQIPAAAASAPLPGKPLQPEEPSLPHSLPVMGLSVYPDPHCRALKEAISAKYGVSADGVFCANGAADIIFRLAFALRPAKALLIAPDFGEYRQALSAVGTEISYFQLAVRKGSWEADGGGIWTAEMEEMFLRQIKPETDLVIFSNPNNPSGTLMPTIFTDRILKRCIECGTLLVVDECFMDFLPDAALRTMLSRISESGGQLLVLRAFTKFYGMAGLRLGWCASSSADLLKALERFGPPWQVSSAAQTAGIAALSDTSYEKELRELVVRERDYMTEALCRRGYHVLPGSANYILFYSNDPCLHEHLLTLGIMIRDCSDYPGLSPGWYRIAVRTHADNEVLLGYL